MAPTSHPGRWLAGLTLLPVAGTLVAAALQYVRTDQTGAVFTFLFWNLFLAWIPFLLALAMTGLYRLRAPGWLLAPVGVVWLLFLPFSLVNLAHWMLPIAARPRAAGWAVRLLRLLALSFTLTLLAAMTAGAGQSWMLADRGPRMLGRRWLGRLIAARARCRVWGCWSGGGGEAFHQASTALPARGGGCAGG